MPNIPTIKLNNGVNIPQLGLGVWQASDNEAGTAVTAAIDAGYRLIDTATVYGNETGVGRAIAASDVPREELFITTKLWNSDQGYESTLKAFDESLKRLGLNYIDLYLIHWPTPARGLFVDTWRALEKLYEQKKVRAIGVSNFRIEDLEMLASKCAVTPVINQVELHPDFQQIDLRNYSNSHGIATESWSPLGGSRSKNAVLDLPLIKDLATRYGKSPAQIALRWHIQSGLVVIPKSVHAERIRENINVFDFELSDDDMARIAELNGDNRLGPDPANMNNS